MQRNRQAGGMNIEIKHPSEKEAILELKKRKEIEYMDFEINESGRVVELTFHGNEMEEIPEIIKVFSQLKYLKIGGDFFIKNKIKKIENLDNFTELEILDLENNQIRKIEGLEKLVRLKKLFLAWNKIKKIEGLDNLSKLQILDLLGNQIKKIEGLERLSQLRVLFLHHNWIEEIEGLENLSQLKKVET